jgi:methionyl-tRNA formyltransferase
MTYRLDLLVVAAYGLILPQAALDIPRSGCINVHASLLPRWRGAAPIERALLAGDSTTGVCLMRMEAGLDTGPVYACRDVPITAESTGQTLEHELAQIGAALLIEHLPRIPASTPVPQATEGVCYAPKLSAAEGQIDWLQGAHEIERQLRALSPRIPVYTPISTAEGEVRLFVLEAHANSEGKGPPGSILSVHPKAGLEVGCGTGSLFIKRLRLSRGKGLPLSIAEAMNGFRS